MLNRWIKPNQTLDEVMAREVMAKYMLPAWYTTVIIHSFMMHTDGTVEFNAEIRCDCDGIRDVEFKRGFL